MLAVAHYDWPYNVRELESAVRVAVTLSSGVPLDLPHLPETVRRALEGHGAPAQANRDPIPTPVATAQTFRDPGRHLEPPSAYVPVQSTPAARAPAAKARGETPSEEELRELLTRHRGNIAAVGRELGKERMQVHRWLRRYSLDIEDFRR
jgi:transcriptional regulator of acetoin/glycerol metabolism